MTPEAAYRGVTISHRVSCSTMNAIAKANNMYFDSKTGWFYFMSAPPSTHVPDEWSTSMTVKEKKKHCQEESAVYERSNDKCRENCQGRYVNSDRTGCSDEPTVPSDNDDCGVNEKTDEITGKCREKCKRGYVLNKDRDACITRRQKKEDASQSGRVVVYNPTPCDEVQEYSRAEQKAYKALRRSSRRLGKRNSENGA